MSDWKPQQVGETCSKCGKAPIVLSQTNKPYCEDKCWLTAEEKSRPYSPPLAATPVAQPVQPPANTDTQNNIRWCNALNNACLLLSNENITHDDEITRKRLISLANFIYLLEAAPKPAPLPVMTNEEIKEALDINTAPPIAQEVSPQATPAAPVSTVALPAGSEWCSKLCGAEVKEKTLEYSKKRFGAPVCFDCQKLQ